MRASVRLRRDYQGKLIWNLSALNSALLLNFSQHSWWWGCFSSFPPKAEEKILENGVKMNIKNCKTKSLEEEMHKKCWKCEISGRVERGGRVPRGQWSPSTSLNGQTLHGHVSLPEGAIFNRLIRSHPIGGLLKITRRIECCQVHITWEYYFWAVYKTTWWWIMQKIRSQTSGLYIFPVNPTKNTSCGRCD